MKNFKLFLILIIFQSCTHEVKELSEIRKLSKIDFPEQCDVIFYDDDYEGLLIFQLEIDFSKNESFLKKNNFKKFDKSKYLHTIFSKDELSIQQINQHFKDKIYVNDDVMLLRKDNYIMVIDSVDNRLWGYLNY